MTAEQLIESPLAACQKVLLQKLTATVFEHIAFRLHKSALYPYQQSLTHFPFSHIGKAPQARIRDIVDTNAFGQNI